MKDDDLKDIALAIGSLYVLAATVNEGLLEFSSADRKEFASIWNGLKYTCANPLLDDEFRSVTKRMLSDFEQNPFINFHKLFG